MAVVNRVNAINGGDSLAKKKKHTPFCTCIKVSWHHDDEIVLRTPYENWDFYTPFLPRRTHFS